jgi:glycosyltransferase involved in cell wall biosynthesis
MTTYLTLVIPCYNEEKRLPLAQFQEFLHAHERVSYLFVNDGSTDGTLAMLNSFANQMGPRAQVLNLEKNSGKAEAVRRGMLEVKTAYAGYWDADLATPLDESISMLQILDEKHSWMILGCRINRLGAHVHRKLSRHYLGRVFATCASLALGLSVYDTQCGSKIIDQRFLSQLFDRPFMSRWLFDVEILFRIKALKGFHRDVLFELPLMHWMDEHGSKLKLRDFLRAPLELWQMARHYR